MKVNSSALGRRKSMRSVGSSPGEVEFMPLMKRSTRMGIMMIEMLMMIMMMMMVVVMMIIIMMRSVGCGDDSG